ncbi:L-lactate dehydrogenase (cytochrome) [Diaphorobacter nitroreducens]|uniref:L-lactate dehydrogenase (Cytochrome) n=1 Tax=Diaphorobacter nitroreducens TaxID=164759 RepID=A0AAX1WTI5_9BURK|nr:L-lactate dehydrogenase (cytochrome) [Diaphorobacter nitroreducens]
MLPDLSYPASTEDWRRLAARSLPRFLFDYIDGGASGERTLAANVQDFAALRLRQRVLVDVAEVDTRATLAGQPCALPLALAPVGLAGMAARRGEAQAARAAHAAGVPFTLSTVGICPISEVAAAADAPPWFQLYMLRDRGAVRALLDGAWAAGCRTLVFTVDLPLPGMRLRDIRHGMAASGARPALIRAAQVLARPGWVRDVALRGQPLRFGNLTAQVPGARDLGAFKAWVDAQFDPSVTWQDIDWLRGQWKGRLLLKGILDVHDAQAAVQVGADGASSTAWPRPPPSCPPSPRPWARRPRCWWTAACAAAWMCSRPWPWGRAACSSAVPGCGRWRRRARRACAPCWPSGSASCCWQ